MQVRKYNPEIDYPTIAQWYLDWNNISITENDILSNEGFMVLDNELPICCGFTCKIGNSKVFYFDGFISNKKIDRNLRKSGLILLSNSLISLSKELGGEAIFFISKKTTIKDIFSELGFSISDDQYSYFTRLI